MWCDFAGAQGPKSCGPPLLAGREDLAINLPEGGY